ncbi:MAG: hypothetical protein PHO70_06930 [Candidatus Omnitrophica bacterium]|nr:hypothetical protein [Candidatus Omnitrophota bacterium]
MFGRKLFVGFFVALFLFSFSYVLAEPAERVIAKDDAITLAMSEATQSKVQEEELSEDSGQRSYRQQLKTIIKEETESEEAAMPQEVDSYVRFIPKKTVKAMDGKVGITNAATEYSYDWKAFGKIPVEFALGSGYIGINESVQQVSLPSQLTRLSMGAEVTLPVLVVDKTYVRFGLSPTFLADGWDYAAADFRLLGRCFLINQPNDKWVFIAGVAVFPETKNRIVPIAGFIYKPNDKLTFNIMPDRPYVSYLLNKKLTVFVEGGSAGGEYVVDMDNQHTNVKLDYNELHAGLGLKYKVNKFAECSLSSGSVFNHNLEYRESLGKVAIKNGMYTEFRVDLRI